MRVGVFGLGQIGSSLAMALADAGFEVFASSFSSKTLRKAKKVFEGREILTGDPSSLSNCNVVFICTHIDGYPKAIELLPSNLRKKAVFSDTGSVKSFFPTLCKRYGIERFAGAHPIAGTERSGPESANPQLFCSKYCIISGWSDERSKKLIAKIWRALGSKVIFMTPEEHDEYLAWVSHLPHVLAYALVLSLPEKYTKLLSRKVAGGSFADITRVAKSPPEMWSQIFKHNRKNVEKNLREFLKTAKEILSDPTTLLSTPQKLRKMKL